MFRLLFSFERAELSPSNWINDQCRSGSSRLKIIAESRVRPEEFLLHPANAGLSLPLRVRRSPTSSRRNIGTLRTFRFKWLAAAGCETVFEDQGLSGVTAARPGLRAALKGAKEGDTLTVWRIDRLGRSTLHLQIQNNRGRDNGYAS
jgi:hypothetical protein